MDTLKSKSILNDIIKKGGLIADIAKLYSNNSTLSHLFILEFAEQCHLKLIKDYLGNNVIKDIIKYIEVSKKIAVYNEAIKIPIHYKNLIKK